MHSLSRMSHIITQITAFFNNSPGTDQRKFCFSGGPSDGKKNTINAGNTKAPHIELLYSQMKDAFTATGSYRNGGFVHE